MSSSLPSSSPRRDDAPGPRRSVRRPQISIAFMLLSMTIICAMSAAMFYASRVPAIQNEVFSWFGKEVEPSEAKRTVHLTFLLFTYSAPLLLAGLLGLIVSVLRWINPYLTDQSTGGPSSPWDDDETQTVRSSQEDSSRTRRS